MYSLYKSIENCIDIVYYTDRRTFSREKYTLFFSFELNPKHFNSQGKLLEIIQFVHYFVDNMSLIKQSASVRLKILNIRKKTRLKE